MDRLLNAALLAVVASASFVAFMVVVGALFSSRVGKIQQVAGQTPGRAFLLGAINFLFFGALGLGFASLGDGVWRGFAIPAVILFGLLAISLVFGLAGVTALLGNRLFPEQIQFRRSTKGALALYLACLLPYIGWFAMLPYAALLGLGGLILSFFRAPEPVLET